MWRVLRRILDRADDGTLVLLDEIGSGTDSGRRSGSGWRGAAPLTRRGHDHARDHPPRRSQGAGVPSARECVNASLQFDSATLQPSYHFQKGVPGRSYGLAIARRLGFPKTVLTESRSSRFPMPSEDLDALLASVEERQREQEHGAKRSSRHGKLRRSCASSVRLEYSGQRLRNPTRRSSTRREKEAERAAREQSAQSLLESRQRVEEAIAKAREAGDEAAAREARRLVEAAAKEEAEAIARLGGSACPERERGSIGGSAMSKPTLEPGSRGYGWTAGPWAR